MCQLGFSKQNQLDISIEKEKDLFRELAHTVVGANKSKSTGQVGQLKVQAVSVSSRSPFTGTSALCSVWGLLTLLKEISFTESLLIINVDHNYKVHSKQHLNSYLTQQRGTSIWSTNWTPLPSQADAKLTIMSVWCFYMVSSAKSTF